MLIVESVWLATKICYAKDLAEKINRTWTIIINLFVPVVRYWRILIPNQMTTKILACRSFGNYILAINQSLALFLLANQIILLL